MMALFTCEMEKSKVGRLVCNLVHPTWTPNTHKLDQYTAHADTCVWVFTGRPKMLPFCSKPAHKTGAQASPFIDLIDPQFTYHDKRKKHSKKYEEKQPMTDDDLGCQNFGER